MYGIDILVKEHDNIQRLNKIVRVMCILVMEGQEPDVDDFREVITFVRNYADKHHHGKEEEILFAVMQEQLGTTAQKLIQNGMLVEHDLGRLLIKQLEEALNLYQETPTKEGKLDIISNACGYTDLLKRHMERENNVAYSYAERSLGADVWESVNQRTKEFEAEALKQQIQEHYLKILKKLEEKYKESAVYN